MKFLNYQLHKYILGREQQRWQSCSSVILVISSFLQYSEKWLSSRRKRASDDFVEAPVTIVSDLQLCYLLCCKSDTLYRYSYKFFDICHYHSVCRSCHY